MMNCQDALLFLFFYFKDVQTRAQLSGNTHAKSQKTSSNVASDLVWVWKKNRQTGGKTYELDPKQKPVWLLRS